MNIVLQTSERTLISLSRSELIGLANALNEVCNGTQISEEEFSSRLGVDRDGLLSLHRELLGQVDAPNGEYEQLDVWAEPASVMVRAVSVYGDPVEMSAGEASVLVQRLQQAIVAAS